MKKDKELEKMDEEQRVSTSLGTIFITFFTTFLVLFIFIIVMSHYRLTEYKNLLNGMAEVSIPKVVNSSTVFNDVNELIYLTEKLNNSNSQAFRRITYSSISKKLFQIRESKNELTNKNPFLENKIEVIQKELFELNSLIDKRLIIEKKIERAVNSIHDINMGVVAEYKNALRLNTQKHLTFDEWRLEFSELVNLTYQALTLKRLNQLRQAILKLEKKHTQIKELIKTVKQPYKKQITPYCNKLEKIVFHADGLLQLKIEQLRITGRAVGRGNFVNNLLQDFSNEINFSLLEHTNDIVKQAKVSSENVQAQVNHMFYLFLFVFLYLIAISYFVNKNVITRLIKLNENVKDKIRGKNRLLTDQKDDEIAHLTHSFNYYAKKINEQKKKLEELSLTDSLTTLANRRLFDMKFSNELNLVKRHNYTISLFIMDIDSFKLYNDNYGHLAGDKCIQKISNVLKKVVKRNLDLVARYGGEEFVAILSNTNVQDSKLMAQKIIDDINSLKIVHKHNLAAQHVTVSIGITTIDKNNTLKEAVLIEQADKALYKAKQEGKNRFVHFQDIKEDFEPKA